MLLPYSLIRSDMFVRLLHNLDTAGLRKSQKQTKMINSFRYFPTQKLGYFLAIDHSVPLQSITWWTKNAVTVACSYFVISRFLETSMP